MKQYISRMTMGLLAGTLCLSAGTAGKELTASEQERALRYLTKTRVGVIAATKGLTEAQWKFKPAPDRWSVAEVVEHLVLIEGAVHGIVGNLSKAPATPAEFDARRIDAMVLAKVADRSTKYPAPEAAVPTGRWSPEDALAHFLAARDESAVLLKSTPDLRGHIVPHPVLGPMDGYEWILAVAAHSERHTQQILEVKAAPHFPSK
jgi:hypothetical protein